MSIELAYLQRCSYEIGQHRAVAARTGVSAR
jgi:hypothetical protein